jgi:hypothetical protein
MMSAAESGRIASADADLPQRGGEAVRPRP